MDAKRQLVRMGTAAWGVGLAMLMDGLADESREWFDRCARSYRISLATATAGSWGRSIGAIKSRILCRDEWGAQREARLMTLELGAGEEESPDPELRSLSRRSCPRRRWARRKHHTALDRTVGLPQPAAKALVTIGSP